MSTPTSDPRLDEQRRSNITLLKKLSVIVVGMFGFGYALVPFYDKICEAGRSGRWSPSSMSTRAKSARWSSRS